jgi:hypothetical protein
VPTCEDSAVMERFKERITSLLDCPMLNTEHLQVLRYEVGQFYKSHHDQNSPVDSSKKVAGVDLFHVFVRGRRVSIFPSTGE